MGKGVQMRTNNVDNRTESENREYELRRAKLQKSYRGDVIKLFICMIACLVLMVVVLYGVLMLIDKLTEARKVISASTDYEVISTAVLYTQEELDEKVAAAVEKARVAGSKDVLNQVHNSFVEGKSVLEFLRNLYPDELVVASGGKYCFSPINKELKLNRWEEKNLVILESGEYQYTANGKVTSHKGIDVSSHQGDIDWMQVAADGVEFAFIRVAYRGYGKEGRLVEDDHFDVNIQGAQAAGIKVGVYMFSQAINEDELREEAELVLAKIAPYQLDCPVVYDVEMISGDGRMNNLSLEDRTNLTLTFCQLIEQAGYTPMIYHNTEMGVVKLDIATLEAYDKWFAAYTNTFYYPYDYKVWQYSEKGTVAGINGNVDMNISFGKLWK